MIIKNGSLFSKIILDNYNKKSLKEFINKNFKKKYYSSILAIFKNEGHIIREWIQHYRVRGIEKIFLINDNSTDDFYCKIEDFVKEGYVSLKNVNEKDNMLEPGRQDLLYNKYYYGIIKQAEWVGILDLDEFVYSPFTKNINEILKKYDETDVQELLVDWYWFGSNGFKEQPESVVDNFTKRGQFLSREYHVGPSYTPLQTCKCFVKTKHLHSFRIHQSNFIFKNNKVFCSNGEAFEGFNVRCSDENELFINHYNVQSEETYKRKIKKGSCNNTPQMKKSMELFKILDLNEVEDLTLKNQKSKTKVAILHNSTNNFEVAICLYETLSKYSELDVGFYKLIENDQFDQLNYIKKYNINLINFEEASKCDIGICVSTEEDKENQIFKNIKIIYISHKFDDFNMYKNEINTNNCLCLSPLSRKVGIDYFTPLEMPMEPKYKNTSKLNLLVQGHFENRNLELLDTIQNYSNFQLTFLGTNFNSSNKFKFDFKILSNLKEIEFYEQIQDCNFILCMINAKIKNKMYIKQKFSSNFLQALCFEKPIFCDEIFKKIYELPGIYYNDNNFKDKFEELLSISEENYIKLVDSYKELKQNLRFKNKRKLLQKIYY